MSSAKEKTLSCGVDDAWTQRYELESSDRRGNVSRLSHHHITGSSDVGTAGSFLYICISFWTLSAIESVLSSATLLFRALSSASKSSSRVDNLCLLGDGVWHMEIKRNRSI